MEDCLRLENPITQTSTAHADIWPAHTFELSYRSMNTKHKSGWSLTELMITLTVIVLLAYVTPSLLRRLLRSSGSSGSSLSGQLIGPHLQPWTLYKSFPSLIEQNKELLTQWGARTTGPGTSGPYVKAPELRLAFLKELKKTFSAIRIPLLPDQDPDGLSDQWGLMMDERGNALLAGGLIVATLRFPLFILKNDGTTVELNKLSPQIETGRERLRPTFPRFEPHDQWLWHRADGQKIVQIGFSLSETTPTVDQTMMKDPLKYSVFVNGELMTHHLEFKRTQPPDGRSLAQQVLKGGIVNSAQQTSLLDGYWTKNRFGVGIFQATLDGSFLSPLSFQLE